MNIFNYESKVNQIVMMLADLIILNLLYLVCCIPIVTIGAAQAGMFTGIRVLLDKDDDSPVYRAFFRGFSNGFRKITVVNVVLLGIIVLLTFVLAYALAFMFAGGSSLAVILCGAAMCIVYILHCVSAPFHATFDCTAGQLFRNSFFVAMAYPLRSVLMSALILLPLVVLMVWPHIFLGGLVVFSALYYSVAYLVSFSLFKKPFQRLKDNFHAASTTSEELQTADLTSESCETADDTEPDAN